MIEVSMLFNHRMMTAPFEKARCEVGEGIEVWPPCIVRSRIVVPPESGEDRCLDLREPTSLIVIFVDHPIDMVDQVQVDGETVPVGDSSKSGLNQYSGD